MSGTLRHWSTAGEEQARLHGPVYCAPLLESPARSPASGAEQREHRHPEIERAKSADLAACPFSTFRGVTFVAQHTASPSLTLV